MSLEAPYVSCIYHLQEAVDESLERPEDTATIYSRRFPHMSNRYRTSGDSNLQISLRAEPGGYEGAKPRLLQLPATASEGQCNKGCCRGNTGVKLTPCLIPTIII